jgi:hypothetical protein
MLNSADARRRWFGVFFLILAVGMLIWGQTVLEPHLQGVVYLVYWFGCFLMTLIAVVIALLDVRALRRHSREEQRELIERTLGRDKTEESDPPEEKE